MDGDGIRELRALQAKAYGRDGGLTDAEARRLREIERSATTTATATVEPEPVSESPAAAAVPVTPPTHSAAPRDAGPSASVRTVWKRYALPAALAALVFVAVGVLLGWVVFGDRGTAPAQLSADQQQWQSELVASGVYDPGSIRPVRTERDTVVWFATKDEGSLVCLVLGDGKTSAPACAAREQALQVGLHSSLVAVADDDEVPYEVGAQMYLTDAGEPAVVTYSYITTSQSTTMFASAEEAAVAESLAEAGFDGRSVAVVGYDGDVPIWVAVEKTTQRTCLVYDGSQPDPEMVCEEALAPSDAGATLVLDHVDDDGERSRFEYTFGYAQQYLTISRGEGSDDARG